MRRCVGIELGGHSIDAVVTSVDAPGSPADRMSMPPVLVTARGMGTLVGADAEQFAASGVGAVFRDFCGRVGDPVPVIGSDGSARLGADLVAMTVGGLLRQCTAGSDAAQLVIAHPSGWGPYEMSVLHSALTCTEAEGVPTSMVSIPVAAVTAAVAAGAMSCSETVIVADIGAHGTDVSLVTGAENHVGRLEATARTDDLGSAELDKTLASHVLEQVRGHFTHSDGTDPSYRATVRDVVTACRRARQDLVQHTSAVIDVCLPTQRIPVRIVRAEFEELVRKAIDAGVSTIAHVFRQARQNGIEVNAIMITGEVSRIPLLTELVSAQWSGRLVIPPCPEWAAATGAAQIAVRRAPSRPITSMRPARPKVPSSQQPQSVQSRAIPPRDKPLIRHVRLTGERKWTLRWGTVQVTAALVPRHG
jgi:molecular chaperone DnaK (HSP70)